VGEEEEHG